MESNDNDNTDSEIAYWVPKYILGHGLVRFQDLGCMSPFMKNIVISQGVIGWRKFIEGHVSELVYSKQNVHLSILLNGGDWMKTFISKILHITHSQWIYCNISLCDCRRGETAIQTRLVLHEIPLVPP